MSFTLCGLAFIVISSRKWKLNSKWQNSNFKQISITNQSNLKGVVLFGLLELGDLDIVCFLFISPWYFLNSSIQRFWVIPYHFSIVVVKIMFPFKLDQIEKKMVMIPFQKRLPEGPEALERTKREHHHLNPLRHYRNPIGTLFWQPL